MLTVVSHAAVALVTSHAEVAAMTSMTNTIARRGTNAGGGGPRNFMAKRPTKVTAPQANASSGSGLRRPPNRAPSMALSQRTSAARVAYLTTIIG